MERMKKVILQFIKGIGISIILNREEFGTEFKVLYYNWIGIDDKFYSLLVPCSVATIYRADSYAIPGNSIEGTLKHNLRVFDTKEEWNSGKWGREYAQDYCERINSYTACLITKKCETSNYKLLEVKPWTVPCPGLTVWFSYQGQPDSLTVWLGACTTKQAQTSEFQEFIEQLGIAGMVNVVVQPPQTLAIESCNSYTN